MLAYDRVKTLTVYTRRELISLFEELKEKTNAFFEENSPQTLNGLDTILKAIMYLTAVPEFVLQFNCVGDIMVTAYLEKIIIKANMYKADCLKPLLLRLSQIFQKEFRENGGQMDNNTSGIRFTIEAMRLALNENDLRLLGVLVEFMRIFMTWKIQERSTFLQMEPSITVWTSACQSLLQVGRVLDNAKREESIISICLYLCASTEELCRSCVAAGGYPYFMKCLDGKSVTETQGRRLIWLLRLLTASLQQKQLKSGKLLLVDFQKVVCRFSMRFESEGIKIILRQLLALVEKRLAGLVQFKHEHKFADLMISYAEYSDKKGKDKATTVLMGLRLINLYLSSSMMSEALISNRDMLTQILMKELNITVLKQVISILAFSYKRSCLHQAGPIKLIQIISKLISQGQHKEVLMADRKRLLIEFVRTLNEILTIQKYFESIRDAVQSYKLENKLQNYSDFTNISFQNELYALKSALHGDRTMESKNMQSTDAVLFEALKKAMGPTKKGKAQYLQQLQLLDQLICRAEVRVTEEVVSTVVGRIQRVQFGLLQGQDEQLQSEINLCCLRILNDLASKEQQCPFVKESYVVNTIQELRKDQKMSQLCRRFLVLIHVEADIHPVSKHPAKQTINEHAKSQQKSVTKSVEEQAKPQINGNANQKNKVEHENVSNPKGEDSALIHMIESLLRPNTQRTIGIKELSLKLCHIATNEYARLLVSLFVVSAKLYAEDSCVLTDSLLEVQTRIVEHIPQANCEKTAEFYQMIGLNPTGASICLRKKGVGVKGLGILCQKILKDKDSSQFCMYLQMIYFNADSLEELKFLHESKLHDWINNTYPKYSEDKEMMRAMGNLIGSTSRYRPIQDRYEVSKHLIQSLQIHRQDYITMSATFSALAGIVYKHEKHRKVVGTQANLQMFLEIMQKQQSDLITEKCCNLLSNLLYQNPSLGNLMITLKVETKLLQIIERYMNYNKYPESTLREALRLVGNLACSIDIAKRIIERGYLAICKRLTISCLDLHFYEVARLGLQVLAALIGFVEIEVKELISMLQGQGLLAFLFEFAYLAMYNEEVIDAILTVFINLLVTDQMLQACLEAKPNLVQLLREVANWQQYSRAIHCKWTATLWILLKRFDFRYCKDIVCTNILGRAANYLKTVGDASAPTGDIYMLVFVNVQEHVEFHSLVRHSFLDFALQIVKAKCSKPEDTFRIVRELASLHQKHGFSKANCLKIFLALLARFEMECKDEAAIASIALLQVIKTKLELPSQTAFSLLQFACSFLSQGELISLPSYHRRIREVLGLLSYLMIFNRNIKLVFQDQYLLSILRNWMKVETILGGKSQIADACRLIICCIFNQYRHLVLTEDFSAQQIVGIEQSLEKGFKCSLYRYDGTIKPALVSFDRKSKEIIAHKPKGQIKPKYMLPIDSILCIRAAFTTEDQIYGDSWFARSSSNFKKGPCIEQCVTIMAMVESQVCVKEINVQFSKAEDMRRFLEGLRVIVSACQERIRQGRGSPVVTL